MPSFDFPEIPGGDASIRKDEDRGVDALVNTSPTSIKIIVPREPVPKGRPRARIVEPRSKPRFISFYQDADTEAYEKRVAWQAKAAMQGRGLLIGALRVEMMVYLPVPQSWSAIKHSRAVDGIILPVSRPDADNFLKIIDACNGVCWKDDAQIVDMTVKKRYSIEPRLEIEIFAV
jgi:Holliday junction resolvase RusA-like endonuclease